MDVGTQLVVSLYDGFRKDFFQDRDEVAQSNLLGFGTCIGRFTFGRESAFAADADGVQVETLGVRTHALQPSGVMHQSVRFDVEVVADAVEASLAVGDFQHIGVEGNIAARRAAMYHNQADVPFGVFFR